MLHVFTTMIKFLNRSTGIFLPVSFLVSVVDVSTLSVSLSSSSSSSSLSSSSLISGIS